MQFDIRFDIRFEVKYFNLNHHFFASSTIRLRLQRFTIRLDNKSRSETLLCRYLHWTEYQDIIQFLQYDYDQITVGLEEIRDDCETQEGASEAIETSKSCQVQKSTQTLATCCKGTYK